MEKLLKDILSVQSTSYEQTAMQKWIVDNYPTSEMDEHGNIYITKGESDSYPCVVAHLDTVHDIIKDNHYHVREAGGRAFAINSKTMEFTGVGGDDKCGIYVALYCLEYFDTIKVALFVDEEVGCQGSAKADMNFFKDVAYAIQCDRQGYTDVVTNIFGTTIASREFVNDIQEFIDSFSKEECLNGGLTDVYQLTENKIGVSTINLSCGYYRPHTAKEYIDLEDLNYTRDFVVCVIEKLGTKRYEHTPTYTGYGGYGRYYGYGGDAWDDGYEYTGYGTGATKKKTEDNGKKRQLPDDFYGIDHQCPVCKGWDTLPDDFSTELYCFSCQDYTDSLVPPNDDHLEDDSQYDFSDNKLSEDVADCLTDEQKEDLEAMQNYTDEQLKESGFTDDEISFLRIVGELPTNQEE